MNPKPTTPIKGILVLVGVCVYEVVFCFLWFYSYELFNATRSLVRYWVHFNILPFVNFAFLGLGMIVAPRIFYPGLTFLVTSLFRSKRTVPAAEGIKITRGLGLLLILGGLVYLVRYSRVLAHGLAH